MPPVISGMDILSTSRLLNKFPSSFNMTALPASTIATPSCKSSCNSEPALYSTSPESREPFTKRSKLHNLKMASVRRRATNSPILENHTDNTEHTDNADASSPYLNTPKAHTEVKSGTLVLVSSQRKAVERPRSNSYPSSDSPYTRQPSRCPSIVQVCRKCFEHYAVIRSTKHRLTEQPQFLNLRKSSVFLSDSRPTEFSVYLNGAEGKVFTFEAGSPEVAREWVRVFSPFRSEQSGTETLQRFSPLRTPFAAMNNCEILEEEDESEDSPLPASSSFDINPQSNMPKELTDDHSKLSDTFSKPSMKIDFSRDGLSLSSTHHRFLLPSHDIHNLVHDNSSRSSDAFEPISKATSMPVLYEDEENEE